MNQKKIGKRISERRKLKKLTGQDLANKLNVTSRTIINWENGKCYPDYALLLPLCEELDISINELLTGEVTKEQKANATTELILDYLDRNRNENLKGYNKVGRLFLIGGIILMIIGVQIPIDFFREQIFVDSILSMYPIVGLIFSFIGFKFINKKFSFKKRFFKNLIYLLTSVLFLLIVDIISITYYDNIPRYYINNIVDYEKNNGLIYFETPFYDAYTCNYLNYKIIPPSVKRYNEKDIDYLMNKYCNKLNNDIGGENK